VPAVRDQSQDRLQVGEAVYGRRDGRAEGPQSGAEAPQQRGQRRGGGGGDRGAVGSSYVGPQEAACATGAGASWRRLAGAGAITAGVVLIALA